MADYTEQQLIGALRKADAVGDVAAAKAIARRIQSMRQPAGMLEAGNIDLHKRPVVRNPDGSISTVRSISANFDGREVLIPTVSDDGRIMSDDEAIQNYQRTGKHLGMFATPEAATRYAERLHSQQEAEYAKPRADFSDVQSSVSQSQPEAVAGPLAPSVYGERAAPSLASVNAKNRAYTASPQFAQDRASAEAFQTQEKARQYAELPAPVRGIVGMGKAAGNAVMGLAQIAGAADESDVDALRARDAYLEGDTATGVGNVAGDLALMAIPATRLSRLAGAGRAAQLAANVGAGAGFAAMQPVGDGESRTQNAALGGAFGALGTGAAAGLERLGTRAATAIKPEVRALYEAAKARGINLTPTQLSDSRFMKFLESQLRSLPLSGAQSRATAQRADWNRAVARTIGSDADAVTPEVYGATKAQLGREFNRLTEQNQLPLSPAVMDRMRAVAKEAADLGDDESVSAVNRAIERVISQSQNGVLPGRAYQSLDSSLGKAMKAGGEKAHYVGQLRDALRTSMDEAIDPADQAAWQAVRQKYKNLKTLRDIVPQDGGDISPAALRGRVTANQAGKEAAASGKAGELGVLAQIGQRMKEPQSSGTAERLWLLATGAGGLANLPGTLAGLAAGNVTGRALNSPVLSRYLVSEGRGQGTQALARMLKAGTPAAAPAAANEVNKERKPRKDKR